MMRKDGRSQRWDASK